MVQPIGQPDSGLRDTVADGKANANVGGKRHNFPPPKLLTQRRGNVHRFARNR